MSEVARARAKYAQYASDASNTATKALVLALGVNLHISELTNRALSAAQEQWGGAKFDWVEIKRNYRDPDTMSIAIWVESRLCGMAIASSSGRSIRLHYVEGDPRTDCPLKGKRLLVALEAVTNYAQLRGKSEICLEPINEDLINLYENVYGFEVVKAGKDRIFCRKQV